MARPVTDDCPDVSFNAIRSIGHGGLAVFFWCNTRPELDAVNTVR